MYLIITIDTENLQTPFHAGAYEGNVIDLEVDDEPVGATRIAQICEGFGVRATFFVNVYEYPRIGEQFLAELSRGLTARGHDVQLHTHPVWVDRRQRKHMWHFSLAEQTDIIRRGAELLRDWTGRYPLAHRAGAYGLNADTLRALRNNGIPVDSSMFFGHGNCKLVWTRNALLERNGIIEIPVTGFYRRRRRRLGPLSVPGRRHFVKTDIDWCSLGELVWFIDEAERLDLRVMNLFLHSYSLFSHDGDYRSFGPNRENIRKFEQVLEYAVNRRRITVMTVSELYAAYQRNPTLFLGSDEVPRALPA